MPGLVINGKEEQVKGLTIVNYKDDLRLKLKPGEDMRARNTRWIRSIAWHNTKNIPTVVKDGKGPNTDLDHRIAKLWSTDSRNAGAHLSVDWDGTICCHADLLLDATYHAGTLNEVSIGGEIYEDGGGVIYDYQLQRCLLLTEWLCKRFGIQRIIPMARSNSTIKRIVNGGKDCVGIFGHCHNKAEKPNDPGFHIFDLLKTVGFKEVNFDVGDDRAVWREIQRKLDVEPDGVPGPATRDALQAKGYAYGIYDWSLPL